METLYTPCAQKCFRWQSWGKTNKQTVQFRIQRGGTRTAQTTPLLTACQSCRSPPPWPEPSPGLAAGTKPPLCVPALGSQPGRTLGRLHHGLRLRPFGQAEVGGWGRLSGGGMTDGVCVGTMPPARLSTCEKGQCAANLQCRSPPLQAHFGKRRINGWHKAGLRWWQMSFPFWFLTPFFPNSGLLLQKRNPSPLIVCFRHNPRSASGLPH